MDGLTNHATGISARRSASRNHDAQGDDGDAAILMLLSDQCRRLTLLDLVLSVAHSSACSRKRFRPRHGAAAAIDKI